MIDSHRLTKIDDLVIRLLRKQSVVFPFWEPGGCESPLLARATTPTVAFEALPSGKSRKLVEEAACREFASLTGALSDDWQYFPALWFRLPRYSARSQAALPAW